MPITLSWVPPSADSSPESPLETVSGLKEIRVYRSEVGYAARELVATLAASATIWQSNAYSNGRFSVVMVDNAGNMSTLAEVQYPASDVTPPPPVTNLEISASTVTPPPASIARVDQITVDLTGANYTIVDNDPAYSTVVTFLTDDNSPAGTYLAVATLAPGVTSGRLNKTWVQGTHTFVCIKAAQNATETEQQCRPLSSLWAVTVSLQNMTVSPLTIAGTGTAVGNVTLTGQAPSGGISIALASSNPSILSVPASITIPQGQSAGTFTLTTANPTTATSVTITAILGGSSVNVSGISVTPFSGEVGGGDPNWTNLPQSLTVKTSHGFTGSLTGNGWLTGGGPSLVSDATAPLSPPGVARFTFPAGYVGGSSPGMLYWESQIGATQAFIGIKMKFSNPWDGHSAGDKVGMIFHQSFEEMFSVNFHEQASGQMALVVYNPSISGISNGHVSGTYGDDPGTRQFPGSLSALKGEWFTVEMYVKKSTSQTSRDGILRAWINGNQAMNYTNINTRNQPFAISHIAPVWGGTGEQKAQTDYLWYDHIILAGD